MTKSRIVLVIRECWRPNEDSGPHRSCIKAIIRWQSAMIGDWTLDLPHEEGVDLPPILAASIDALDITHCICAQQII